MTIKDVLYWTEIKAAATKWGLDPPVVAAVVEQESSYRFYAYRYEPKFWEKYLAGNPTYAGRDPYEVSASIGLMQVMYSTAVDAGFGGQPWDLFDPVKNLDIGCKILSDLLTWARTQYRGLTSSAERAVLRKALAAYNGGRGGTERNDPQQYALAVLGRYDKLRKILTPSPA